MDKVLPTVSTTTPVAPNATPTTTQTPQPSQTTWDPQIVLLAQSIRQAETGNQQVPGKTGEISSRYQWLPDTWAKAAGQYLGDSNAPINLQNENYVAYQRIKAWKDQGYNPMQIASLWNSGNPDPNNNSTTAAYAQKVYSLYTQSKKPQQPPPSASSGSILPQGGVPDIPSVPGSGVPSDVANTVIGGVNALKDVGVGVGSEVIKAGIGLGEGAAEGVQEVSELMGNKTGEKFYGDVASQAENLRQGVGEAVAPNTSTLPGLAGKGVGQAAILLSPGSDLAKAKDIASGAAEAATKGASVLPYVGKAIAATAKTAARAVPEAAAGFGYGLSQGQTPSQSAETGVIFGALSALGEATRGIWRAYKGNVADNVSKAVGMTGPMDLATAKAKIPKAIVAFKTIADNAENITVKDIDGVERKFNPVKATFSDMLQALHQTKNIVYQKYSALAKRAGDIGASFTAGDFQKVISDLEKIKKDATSSFVSKADSLISDIKRNFASVNPKTGETSWFPNIPFERIQTFLENVNKDVNPVSDGAGAVVSGEASQSIRRILDEKISGATDEGYQELRTQYASLRSIENEIVGQFKKAARGIKGFSSYVEGYGVLDTIAGMFSSPVEAARGAMLTALGAVMKKLRDPETYLQRAFQQITDTGATKATSGAIPRISAGAVSNILPMSQQPTQ